LDEAADCPGSHAQWGKTLGKKSPVAIHLFFQNVGGIPTGKDGNMKLLMMHQFLALHEADVSGCIETNTCWDVQPYKD